MIGVARDGHLVYGPYNSNGEDWQCHEHDACNGFFMPDGSYAYASTKNGVVKCWLPATNADSCNEKNCIFYSKYVEDMLIYKWNWKYTVVTSALGLLLFGSVAICVIIRRKRRAA